MVAFKDLFQWMEGYAYGILQKSFKETIGISTDNLAKCEFYSIIHENQAFSAQMFLASSAIFASEIIRILEFCKEHDADPESIDGIDYSINLLKVFGRDLTKTMKENVEKEDWGLDTTEWFE